MGQQVLNAIFIGSIYALFAVGYTLVFGVLDILNLAHSAVFMLGAAITYSLVVNYHQSFAVACVLGIASCAVMGLVIEYICLRPLRRRRAPPIAALISTIGLALIIVAAVEQGRQGSIFSWLWVDGANSVSFPSGTVPNPTWHVGGLTLEATKVAIVPVTVALMLVLGYFIRFTQFGRGLRAVAENPRAASLMGLDVDRMITLTVVLSSALGGAAGILFGLAISDISPYIGRDNLEIRGLAVIVLGGMGSIPGAVAGGYLLGAIEVLALVVFGSNVRAGVAFAALFLMLVLRPQGLFGAQVHERL
ncbi:MAG TPA: branched-chain amino acid ABC transporter permease [Candidatus Dormibacteraeota bacterium]|nr:branched-chain amino acid ABC transporter permease [Candidatus Dormibacteraeota bacterium]